MTFAIHETSNPYEIESITTEDGEMVIVMAVDQLFVDPDSSEQKVITEYYERQCLQG